MHCACDVLCENIHLNDAAANWNLRDWKTRHCIGWSRLQRISVLMILLSRGWLLAYCCAGACEWLWLVCRLADTLSLWLVNLSVVSSVQPPQLYILYRTVHSVVCLCVSVLNWLMHVLLLSVCRSLYIRWLTAHLMTSLSRRRCHCPCSKLL